jgi:hypothetical protein
MPFLQHDLSILGGRSKRVNRGSQPDFWELVDEIADISKANRIDARVPRRVLACGNCPGLFRMFYTLRGLRVRNKKLRRRRYLGTPINSRTRKKLGIEFEGWVHAANDAYNRFIESRNLAEFGSISQPGLRRFYERRARQHLSERLATLGPTLRMDVNQPLVVFPSLPLTNASPDGMFNASTPRGVFESKLSDPSYDSFMEEIAAYALVMERAGKVDVDFAIVLSSGWPHGAIRVEGKPIEDSHVQRVQQNLQRLRDLATASALRRIAKGVRPRRFESWKDFVLRHRERIPPDAKPMCAKCPFRMRCWRDDARLGS